MKCPNCGEEMAEDRLYCEHCGEDIHIVPDFEPELERNMEQSISTIMEDLQEQEPPRKTVPPGPHMGKSPPGKTVQEGASERNAPESSLGRTLPGKAVQEGPLGETQPGQAVQERPLGRTQPGKKPAQKSVPGKPLPSGKTGTSEKSVYLKVLLVLGILLSVTAVVAVRLIFNYFSLDYQVDRAARYAAAGKYDRAISCYDRALELDRGNIELTFSLAEMYLLKDNKVEYEYLLREIIHSEKTSSEQLERAYGKLIAIYRDRGDYQTINDMLLASENETLLATYQNYIARAPEFNLNEGYYTGIQPLKLTALGSGRIYYTLDGSVPTQESSQYTAPIILEDGDYVVTAYFVNENGVASDVVSKIYHIQNDEIPSPQISVYSGEYYAPINIEILDGGDDVFYTTDGSDPTYSSTPYSGPIPMPLGNSIFKFVRVVDGVTGTVVEMHYRLVLNTDLTPQQAVASIVEYSMNTGKIYDKTGHFDESGAMYYYEYQYVSNINQVADFYVIAEFFQDEDGAAAKTGNYFAVDVYNGTRYKLQQDGRKRLNLIEIEEDARAVQTGAESQGGPEGESRPDADSQSGLGGGSQPETGSQAGPQEDSQPEGSQPETGSQSGPQGGSQPEGSQPETGFQGGSQPEAGSQSGPKGGSQPETGSQGGPEEVSQPETGSQGGPEGESLPEGGSDRPAGEFRTGVRIDMAGQM